MTTFTIGAVSLDTVFNNCVKQLEGIRFEKGFAETHPQSLVELRLLQLRLCRWRHALITLIEEEDPDVVKAKGRLAKGKLSLIDDLLKREENYTPASLRAVMAINSSWVVEALETLARKHGRPNGEPKASLIGGMSEYKQLVEELVSYIIDLERTNLSSKLDTSLGRLRQGDANDIKENGRASESDIYALKEVAAKIDPELAKLLIIAQGHQFNDTTINGGWVRVGNEVANGYNGQFADGGHVYNRTTIGQDATAHLGDGYGNSVFDKSDRYSKSSSEKGKGRQAQK